MKKIKTKVELVQQMSELRAALNNIKTGFGALSFNITEASIQLGQLDNALSKLENAEVTTELMITENHTDNNYKKLLLYKIVIVVLIVFILLLLFAF